MKKNGSVKKNGVQNRIRAERFVPQFAQPLFASGDIDIKELLTALTALKKGDFSVRLPLDWNGTAGKIADAFNDVVERNEKMAKELERISLVVGKEGKINQRASIGEVSGSWADSVASVNTLISDLMHPTSETARVIGAVAKGDLAQTMALEIEGQPLEGELLRTAELASANQELEAFTYSVAHDLQAPLRNIQSYAQMLESEFEAAIP